jgi:integrase/recombinase XerD
LSILAPTLQAYFTDRLARQRQASPHTIAAYRDTFKLLLGFACTHTGKAPSRLDVADLDATLIGAFLDHLEHQRGNSVRTRNARLAAIHSLFRFAALHHPQDAAVIQRVLAIPPKRYDQTLITYLTRPRPTRCWPPPTRPPGPDDATTPCWPWRSQPACGSWS